MTGNKRSNEELGLKKARVHLYGGLIFATWNIDGPSFDAFLGDAKFYLDQLFCRSDNGLEMLGPPQRFVLPCNWKIPGEQSGSDGFHTLTLHRSLMEGGIMGGRSEEHTSELQSLMRISYAVFCLKKKNDTHKS